MLCFLAFSISKVPRIQKTYRQNIILLVFQKTFSSLLPVDTGNSLTFTLHRLWSLWSGFTVQGLPELKCEIHVEWALTTNKERRRRFYYQDFNSLVYAYSPFLVSIFCLSYAHCFAIGHECIVLQCWNRMKTTRNICRRKFNGKIICLFTLCLFLSSWIFFSDLKWTEEI